jgi:ribosomal protein S18 acetylase RimI-like enzyme
MIELEIAKSKEEIVKIANLGFVIWQEYYTAIIGEEQVKYMLQKFQTEEAIHDQLGEGYEYFTILYNSLGVGYLACIVQENSLFLSKIYVLKKFRGNGIGKYCLNFLIQKGKDLKLVDISLSVNKYNEDSILFYKKYGFKNIDAQIKDIGDGFIMDDYKMVKKIENTF